MRFARTNEHYFWMGTILQVTVDGEDGDTYVNYRALANGALHNFTVGEQGKMLIINFYGNYRLLRDCEECGTARIRYIDCLNLAYDRKCWSCYGG